MKLSSQGFQVVVGNADLTRLIDGELNYSNVDPGGYETCSFTISQDVRIRKGQRVFIRAGAEEVWQGRVENIGRAMSDGAVRTSVSCIGPGAKLKDNADFAMIFADRDMNSWRDASRARKLGLVTFGFTFPGGVQILADKIDGVPAINLALPPSSNSPINEAWYDAGDATVGEIYYDVTYSSSLGSFRGKVSIQTIDNGDLAHVDSGDLAGAAASASGYLRGTIGQPYAMVNYHCFLAAVAAGANPQANYRKLTVYGLHKLPKRGNDPSGFYAEDIAVFVAKDAGLKIGKVTASSFIVYHAAYKQSVTHEVPIQDMEQLTGFHWGTWGSDNLLDDEPTFWFCERPKRYTCSVSRRNADQLDFDEQLSGLYNRAIIGYTHPSGDDASVTVTRSTEELHEADLTRTTQINMGPGTAATAQAFGAFILLLSERNARAAGSGELPELLDAGRPACTLKAGRDKLLVRDMPEPTFADGLRDEFHVKRVEVRITNEGPKTSVELGLGADLVEVLQARLALANDLAS